MARTWRRVTDDAIQVLNLQKSPYGEQMCINTGLYIRSLGTDLVPSENRCHIQVRLERVIPDHLTIAVASLILQSEPSRLFFEALFTHGVEWLESISSPAGRKRFFGEAVSKKCLIVAEARDQ